MNSPVTISPPLATMNLCDAQPNELDLRRIVRTLEKRERYRYVTVNIAPTSNGYIIQSPCCSRSIATDNHLIDIALLEYDVTAQMWKLFNKNHSERSWNLYRCAETLRPLVEYLSTDPDKAFWQ